MECNASLSFVQRLVGINRSQATCTSLLRNLVIQTEADSIITLSGNGIWSSQVPAYRPPVRDSHKADGRPSDDGIRVRKGPSVQPGFKLRSIIRQQRNDIYLED